MNTRTRHTIYLDKETETQAETLKKALGDEQVLFAGSMPKAAWFRLIFQAGLVSLTQQTKMLQEG
jgi:hypothetical protein